MNTQERLYTFKELSGRFGVHIDTIYRWFHDRPKFQPTRRTVLITETTLQEFIKEKTTKDKDNANE